MVQDPAQTSRTEQKQNFLGNVISEFLLENYHEKFLQNSFVNKINTAYKIGVTKSEYLITLNWSSVKVTV